MRAVISVVSNVKPKICVVKHIRCQNCDENCDQNGYIKYIEVSLDKAYGPYGLAHEFNT